jgi:hypothetical protein
MQEKRLGAVEARFADLIWDHAPINSTALVHLCEKELDWKKSTTYTVLKKLCARGIFQMVGGTVTRCVAGGIRGAQKGALWRRPLPARCRVPGRVCFRKPLSGGRGEGSEVIDAYREGR